jgi:hypothetical protein
MFSGARSRRHRDVAAIVVGGMVAGTIDIGAAALINRANPVHILHFVAGGLVGRPALQGGLAMTGLGIALQWAMSLLIAAIYVVAARRLPVLRGAWIAGGLAYGVVVFFVMNYLVVPFSAWGRAPKFDTAQWVENMAAMLVFGLIVAFTARRFSSPSR